jgi:hypothetical protein
MHLPPLSQINGFHDPWDFVDKSDGSSDVIEDFAVSNLLPGHWHILEELENSMRHVLE